MHVGDGAWVLVDSCGRTDAPTALEYLEILGVDPGEAVKLIVASHWHDDHIRGIAQMAAVCRKAKFCCSNVLCADEFLGVVHALDNRHFAASSSGVREIYSVFSRLREVGGVPTWAVANRRIFVHGLCRIWALSPSDDAFVDFMRAMSPLLPRAGQAETRVPSRSPNEIAVALRIEVGDIAVLLGADLEQRGWSKILAYATAKTGVVRPTRRGRAVERTIGESGIRLQRTPAPGGRSTTSSDRSAHAMAGRIAGSRVPSEGVFRVISVRTWPRTLVRGSITVNAFTASSGPRSGCRLRGEFRCGVEVQSPSRNRGA